MAPPQHPEHNTNAYLEREIVTKKLETKADQKKSVLFY
jgi:hypothetical protein